MNRLLLVSLLVMAVAGCSKTNQPGLATTYTLVGKWTHTENYSGTGGPTQWQAAQPANQVIEFKLNGRFQAASNFLPGVTHYEILDSTRVTFRPANTASGSIVMSYSFEDASTLVLSPLEPMCICGCADKFKQNYPK